MLEAKAERGHLVSRPERHGRPFRRLYRITDLGREALALAMERLRELRGEAEPVRIATDQ